MNRLLFTVALIVLCLTQNISKAQDALSSGFKNPPSSAKARTWWHWIDGNITKQGITADLEAMKRVGIQEAQIFNVGQGYPQGAVTYLSPQWLDLFKFAVTEAKRLNMELAFHNGPGWSSSGGPWVTPENAMQTIVWSEVKVKGGEELNIKLPQPQSKLNYYRDIVVLAFPTPANNQKIENLSDKTLSGGFVPVHLYPSDKAVDEGAIIDKNKIIDLTSKMSPDGSLKWAAPAGDWTILRLGHTPNGTENHPGEAGGQGLEVDKLSRKAMDAYWAAGVKPILDKVGPLVGHTLNNCLIDSYEVGCNNWTAGFANDFKKRNHYDILQYLPTLAGYYVESGEVSERFLFDFRKTLSDMMAENYFGYFGELCHKAGMKFSTEPYGGPFESIKTGETADIVMGEFWLADNPYAESTKLAASIAHLKGSPIAGAESFTSIGGWKNHPATMKQLGDYMWTEGITRFIFHTFAHQPWNTGPGVTFHQYGMDMNRLNTWWEQSRAYMSYIARSQYLLQQGKSHGDALVFADESAPNDALIRSDIKALGYDYDEIGMDDLAKLTVKGGKLWSQSGLSYRLLVLPQLKWATPQLLSKLKQLADAGATIIGPKPLKSPSLQGYPVCDKEVAQLADELWPGKISNLAPAEAFKTLNLPADFSGGATGSDLNFIHRVVGNDDVYFVSNPQAERRDEVCRFRVSGKKPELWNPETGKIEEIAVWRKGADNTTEIPIAFNTNGSIFVIFRGGKPVSNYITNAKITLDHQQQQPLPQLKIIKAEYGTFLPDGMIDVTNIVKTKISADALRASADNGLFTDPAQGSVKQLRIAYELDGKTEELDLDENKHADINFNGHDFKLIRALYGRFGRDVKGVYPKYPVYDVSQKINAKVAANDLAFAVTDNTFDAEPLTGIQRELRLEYSTAGEVHQVTIRQGNILHLDWDGPQPKVIVENGKPTWITPYAGSIAYTNASGKTKIAHAASVVKSIELSGPWEVSFPKASGAPTKTSFDKLISWPVSANENIKYFSGTAIYKKQFTLTAAALKPGNSLELDLSSVGVMAEVIVNGKNLGILWKVPFRIELGNAVHAGKNELEIRVTNLWVNRLIGDAHYPDDLKWNGVVPAEWPKWVDGKSARNSERKAFSTFRHWDANSPLLPSGLMGPVIIRSYQHIKLTP